MARLTVPLTPTHLAKLMTDTDHKQALDRISELMEAKAGTPESEELKRIAILVEEYQKTRWPISKPEDGNTLNTFNPDYLCNDPECKSRSLVQDMAIEYQEYMDAKNANIYDLITEQTICQETNTTLRLLLDSTEAAVKDILTAEGLGFWTNEWREKHAEIVTRLQCERCSGTGAIDAPFSGSDPCCPECDGKGVTP